MLFSPTRIELNNDIQVLAMPQEFEEDFDDPLLEVWKKQKKIINTTLNLILIKIFSGSPNSSYFIDLAHNSNGFWHCGPDFRGITLLS